MCELLLESDATAVHAGDLQFKLSDPSVNCEKAVRVWEQEDGQIIGFAFIHLNCYEFIFETKPCHYRSEIEVEIIEWVLEQFNRASTVDSYRHTFFMTSAPEFALERISLLKSFGFTRDEKYSVYLDYPLDSEIPAAAKLPKGFTIRRLKNADGTQAYIEAHHNAFLFDNLTEQWRRNVLQMPEYIPELDLVAVAPNGEFAAICLCWLEQKQSDTGTVKKGYIQTVGTQHKFQNMGIGQALFVTALHRLKMFGAQVAVGDTDADNTFALRLYESAGVRRLHKTYRYFWNVSSGEEK